MIIVFGFRTPAASEVPSLLYLGLDADAANRVCETTTFPRVALVNNPPLRSYKAWTEEASEAFENSPYAKGLSDPVVGNVHPHLEPGANVPGSEIRMAHDAGATETVVAASAPGEESAPASGPSRKRK